MPELSSSFTRETYKLLSGFSGLTLRSGWSKNTDAILVGVIRSPEKLSDTTSSSDGRVANDIATKNVGDNRPKFYIPTGTTTYLSLQVIVIQRPTQDELALLTSEVGQKVPAQGKVLFNVTFPLTQYYTREVFDEEAGSVVATQNAGAQRRINENLASNAAQQIRDMILYAF